MKQRIFSAAVGLSVFAIVLFFVNTIVFNIGIALVSFLAVYEMLTASKTIKNKFLLAISFIFAAAVPFCNIEMFRPYLGLVFFGYVLILLVIFMAARQSVKVEQLGFVFMVSTLIPLALTTLILMRDLKPEASLFYILIIFAAAWLADCGGYFVGRFLGKHKFAPNISPKKTVEGCIGALILAPAGCLIVGLIYSAVQVNSGTPVMIDYIWLTVISLVGAVVSIFGDLCASMMKRQFMVKDFGSILPGHGGVLDRFDSILLVSPLFYLVFTFFPIMTVVS